MFRWGLILALLALGSCQVLQVLGILPPDAPTDLSVTNPTPTSLDVSWKSSLGAAAYQVSRATSPKGPWSTQTYSSKVTGFTDADLSSGTTYYYEIEATDSAGSSAESGPVSGTTAAAPGPYYSVIYNANGSTGGVVPIDGRTYLQGQSVTVLGNTGGLSKLDYSFAGWSTQADGPATLTQGQTFTMSAANVTLYAAWIPNAPASVLATGENAQVTISWSAAAGATSYNLYWSTSANLTVSNGNKVTAATSPYTQTGLTNGVTYYYLVTSVDQVGESSASGEASASPTSTSNGALAISTPPANTIVINGVSAVNSAATAATYTSTYSGTALSYQWYLDGVAVSPGGTGSGVTVNPSILSYASHVLTLFVTDVSGITYSASVTLSLFTGSASGTVQTVTPPAYLLTVSGPVALSAAATSATFASSYNGKAATYQWYLDGVSAGPGGMASSLTLNPSLLVGSLHLITLFVTDTNGVTYSAGVKLSLSPNISTGIVQTTTPPAYQVIVAGPTSIATSTTVATFTSVYDGRPAAYQWYLDGTAKAKTPGLTLNPSLLSGSLHLVTLFVTDANGITYSSSLSFSLFVPSSTGPLSTAQPATNTVTLSGPSVVRQVASSAAYGSTYDGVAVAYQWYWDGGKISGALSNGLLLNPPTLATGYHLLTLFVTDASGVRYSSGIDVEVTP